MKWLSKKRKKSIIMIVMILFFLAGLLDIKYEGLLFQLLPNKVQSELTELF